MKTYKLQQFEGPLDLLLQMIEQEKLDISEISLASIADQFVQYIQANKDSITGQELTDFLLVATQLLLLKSRILLPDITVEDEVEPDSLEKQLKLYRSFVEAAKRLEAKIAAGQFLFTRKTSALKAESRFSPPPGITKEMMEQAMTAVLVRLEPIVILPESVMEKTVTLQEKIVHIQGLLKHAKGLSFKKLLSQSRSKVEQVVSFLALLELVKQEEVNVSQTTPLDDIIIDRK